MREALVADWSFFWSVFAAASSFCTAAVSVEPAALAVAATRAVPTSRTAMSEARRIGPIIEAVEAPAALA